MTRLMGTALDNIVLATDRRELAAQLARVGLAPAGPRPVIVLIGGASNMTVDETNAAARLINDGLLPAADKLGAALVDGGTAAGVMALAGQAHYDLGATGPLVGVAPLGKVRASGVPGATGDVELEPNHTHFVLAPGDRWGDELPWLADVAEIISDGDPIAAVVVSGGEATAREATEASARGWQVVIIRGSGGTADILAQRVAAGQAHDNEIVLDIAAGGYALTNLLIHLLGGAR